MLSWVLQRHSLSLRQSPNFSVIKGISTAPNKNCHQWDVRQVLPIGGIFVECCIYPLLTLKSVSIRGFFISSPLLHRSDNKLPCIGGIFVECCIYPLLTLKSVSIRGFFISSPLLHHSDNKFLNPECQCVTMCYYGLVHITSYKLMLPHKNIKKESYRQLPITP